MGGADETGVLAVTVLTSIGEEQLTGIGLRAGIGEQVRLLAILAAAAGAEGVVCAPGEAPVVKEASRDLMVVTPGIRLADGDLHDQRRVMTPGAAASAGADYLVIGRAITASDDPVAVARRISKSLIDVG
jgi:orotidine-5'-phosphate decarboxylase